MPIPEVFWAYHTSTLRRQRSCSSCRTVGIFSTWQLIGWAVDSMSEILQNFTFSFGKMMAMFERCWSQQPVSLNSCCFIKFPIGSRRSLLLQDITWATLYTCRRLPLTQWKKKLKPRDVKRRNDLFKLQICGNFLVYSIKNAPPRKRNWLDQARGGMGPAYDTKVKR